MTSRASLEGLASAIKGRAPPEAEWLGVLDLANQGLVTPRLSLALAQADGVPIPVRAFLEAVMARNTRRNAALAAQAERAAQLLNRIGVAPVLLKGAAALFSADPARRDARMLGDLDLLVAPEETGPALAALLRAGYVVLSHKEGVDPHAVAELAKDGEPATIDLHQRPPGPPGMAQIVDLRALCRPAARLQATALEPSAAVQIYLTMLHDQFHDGDYWSGRLNLRHMLDIADLIATGEVDWSQLDGLVRSELTRNALHAQLADAHWMTGAAVPEAILRRGWIRAQRLRRSFQAVHPWAAKPLSLATAVYEWRNLRSHGRENRAGRSTLFGPSEPMPGLGERLARLQDIFASPLAGKV